jgi:hypothetical protein
MMAMWLTRYRKDPDFDHASHPHVPDVLDPDGLKDLMAIGTLLELINVIDHRSYLAGGIPAKERTEAGTCRSMYQQLQSLTGRYFVIFVDGKPILPLLIF